MSIWDGKVVVFTYTNYKGETADRRVVPIRIWYGSTEYHSQEQWFVHAWDLDRQAARDFAWADIFGWAYSPDQSLPWRS